MKIFRTVLTNFAILGIDAKQIPFLHNSRLLLGFAIIGLNIILCITYVLYVATTLKQYVQCINSTLGSVCGSIWFGLTVFHTPKIFEIIDNTEKMIEISE